MPKHQSTPAVMALSKFLHEVAHMPPSTGWPRATERELKRAIG